MLIERIELRDFKSYVQAEIPFRPGTTAIVGENGAGKSTLLEAIGFALFDHSPQGITLSNLLREGRSSGSVVVRLRCGPGNRHCYDIERTFTTNTTTRYRVYNADEAGAVLAEGSADVTAWLHRIFGVDEDMPLKDLFVHTIGVPQGTLTAPFLESPTNRKNIFEPLLRVHEYRRASENLRETVRELEGQANTLQQEVAHLEGQLATREGLQRERDELAQAIREREARIATDQATWEQVSARLGAMEELAERLRTAQADLDRNHALAQAQAIRLENFRHTLNEAQEAEKRVEAARPGHKAYQHARQMLDELEAERQKRDALRDDLARLERQEAELRTQQAHLAEELERLRQAEIRCAALEPALARYEELNARQRDLQQAVAQLDVARREEQRYLEEIELARENLRAAQAAQQRVVELEQTQSDMQARLADLSRQEQEVRIALGRDKAEIDRLERQAEALRTAEGSRCPVCAAELTPQHRERLLAENASALAELRRQVDALEDAAARLDKEHAHLEGESRRVAEALRRLATSADVQRAQEQVERLERALSEARARCAELAELPDKLRNCQEQLALLADAVQEYRALQQRLREGATLLVREAQAREQLALLHGQLQELEQTLQEHSALDERMRELREVLLKHQRDHEDVLRFEPVAQALPRLRQELAQAEEEVHTLEAQIKELEEHQARLAEKYDAIEHARLREEERSLNAKLAEARALQEEQSRRLRVVGENLQQLLAVDQQREARLRDLDEVREMTRILETVRDLLRQAGPHVTRQLVRQISQEAAALYADIMEDPIARLEWSEDYELSLEVKGCRRTFRQFSGGEQMTAALALRLALLRTSSAIDIAFFDEPTAHLDATRREGLADKITQVRGFSQMFVISHDDTFEQAAESYIRVIKGENGSFVEVL